MRHDTPVSVRRFLTAVSGTAQGMQHILAFCGSLPGLKELHPLGKIHGIIFQLLFVRFHPHMKGLHLDLKALAV
jgi:hypothetical protein